jgi:hypothetical protein
MDTDSVFTFAMVDGHLFRAAAAKGNGIVVCAFWFLTCIASSLLEILELLE